jgi:fructoselysine and glucoselysine-specific PTS system IIA component
MRKFLIAAHGSLPAGIKSSLEMIMGSLENVFFLEAYSGENKSIKEELDVVLEQIDQNDELIIFTDLLGGSVTNQMIQFALKENIFIVSGFNLALLLDILLADPETSTNEVIENGIENAKKQIVFVSKLINSNKNKSNG